MSVFGSSRAVSFSVTVGVADGIADMPAYGDPMSPVHHHVAPQYIQETASIFHIPNIVTAVLGSYRGYDTFGETTVIFAATVGVLLLLAGQDLKQMRQDASDDAPEGDAP